MPTSVRSPLAPMRHPRYEVRSITGYNFTAVSGEAKLSTSWWVADTWNCFREVPLRVIVGTKSGPPGLPKIVTRRSTAERNCARLNREHDEWLAQDQRDCEA